MAFSENTRKNLTKLHKILIETKDEEITANISLSFMSGSIPENIEYDKSKGDHVYIDGEVYSQYNACLVSLYQESQLEYMSEGEIGKELWRYVCEISLEARGLKSKTALANAVSKFESQLLKPLEIYEILIPVENIQINQYSWQLDDIKLVKMSTADALDWGITKGDPIKDHLYNSIVDQTVAIIIETGNNQTKAVTRARRKLATFLNALRVSLLIDHQPRIVGWKIHDVEMLFKQGEAYCIRINKKLEGIGLERSFRPVEFQIDNIYDRQLNNSKNIIGSLFDGSVNGRIRERLIRAIDSIGYSINREQNDDKIIDLCTALETLLSSEQDKRKGELIALRMTLLYTLIGLPFFNPVQVLELYDKRSNIVHGSKRDICSDSDCRTAQTITLDVFAKTVTFVSQNKITQHSEFLKFLQKDTGMLKNAIDWWKPYSDYYKDIVEATNSMI